jgi:chromosome segregation ATPase
LEDKAATAGTVAKDAKAKLLRLKESMLNAGYLFGNQNTLKAAGLDSDASVERDNSRKSRKRRQSDGALFLSHGSPTKLDLQMTTTPRTAQKKRKQKVPRQMLSPTSELHIVREALSSRNNLTRALQKSVDDHVQLLQTNDTELEKVVSQNDSLEQEKIETQYQVESLRHTALLAHEKALEEKELLTSNLNDAEGERDNAVQEISRLEAQLQSTCQENAFMMERTATFEHELAKSVSENSVLKNRSIVLISKLKGENNVLEQQLTTLSEKAENVQSQNENLQTDKVILEECLADLSRDHGVSRQENAELEMKLNILEGEMTEVKRLLHVELEMKLNRLEGETTEVNRMLRAAEEKTSALVAENGGLQNVSKERSDEWSGRRHCDATHSMTSRGAQKLGLNNRMNQSSSNPDLSSARAERCLNEGTKSKIKIK